MTRLTAHRFLKATPKATPKNRLLVLDCHAVFKKRLAKTGKADGAPLCKKGKPPKKASQKRKGTPKKPSQSQKQKKGKAPKKSQTKRAKNEIYTQKKDSL